MSVSDTIMANKIVKLLCCLRHNNIVTVFGACLEEPRTAIVMEYCAKGTLTSLIDNKMITKWENKLQFMMQIASGAAYLHSKKIVCITW